MPGKIKETLVERAGIMIFAVFAGEGGAPFVKATRQNGVAAEPYARAARRKLGQIR